MKTSHVLMFVGSHASSGASSQTGSTSIYSFHHVGNKIEAPSSGNSSNTIIGAVIGSVLGLLLIAVITFLLYRRYKSREQTPVDVPMVVPLQQIEHRNSILDGKTDAVIKLEPVAFSKKIHLV